MNEVGEYIRHAGCARRFKLEIDRRREARRLPFHERLFNALDPVLQAEGRQREDAWGQTLREAGLTQLSSDQDVVAWGDFVEMVNALAPGQRAFAREVEVAGRVGAFEVVGRVDFLLVLWEEGTPRLRIVECKASRRDRTYHRVQVALYRELIATALRERPLTIGSARIGPAELDSVVARIDEATNAPQPILELAPLDLAMERTDIASLLAAGGRLEQIARAQLDALPYQLDQKCDGCVFNTDCFPESALHRRLELLSIPPTSVRALHQAGVGAIADLRYLDPAGDIALELRHDPSFTESIPGLVARAGARCRTLPGGDGDPELYDVQAIPDTGYGALPPHETDGVRLVRVYLSVDFDYAENRIGALAAHVTVSEGHIHTGFLQHGGRWRPEPVARERDPERGRVDDLSRLPPVSGEDVVRIKSSPWTGRYDVDSGAERELIETFFNELIEAIATVAPADDVPLHFYVWSAGEMRRLVEACARVDSALLGHLRHLLGCRESLEQLMYSAVGEEIGRRYGLAWTGRGLAVAASLRWYGQRYHWTREIGGEVIALDHVFTQDIFDFKTTLDVDADGAWAERGQGEPQLFEVRSRFFDALSAPYWRALWGTLPAPESVTDARLRGMIQRYTEAGRLRLVREYLRARVHGLRWLEGRVIGKNRDIRKPAVSVEELQRFRLGTRGVRDACIEFLRLDQHVRATEWIRQHVVPPAERVSSFASLPVTDLEQQTDGTIRGRLSFDEYGIGLPVAAANCSIGEGAMVRLTPRPEGPHQGQNMGLLLRLGRTCSLVALDWVTGDVRLSPLPFPKADRYRLMSDGRPLQDELFEHALIEESLSDFVSPHVDARLSRPYGRHIDRWLDPVNPDIPLGVPLSAQEEAMCRDVLDRLRLQTDPLAEDQRNAIVDGLGARIQLLQGPPGTGKTLTCAVALLLRIALRLQTGDVLVLSGPTNTAVDTLLERVIEIEPWFRDAATVAGLAVPPVNLGKVHASRIRERSRSPITDLVPARTTPFVQLRQHGVFVMAGLATGILKAAEKLQQAARFSTAPDGTFARCLFVDEGSMLSFPQLLALATTVRTDGEIVVAGDHRQLAPIVAHDWENEDRPPTVLYQPYVSAYEAIRRLRESERVGDRQIARTALRYSFRLPPEIRELVGRIYARDDIALQGREREEGDGGEGGGESFEHVWTQPTGLFLVLHDEAESRRSNQTEVEIIRRLLEAADGLPDGSVAVITPHRAQRSALAQALAGNRAVDLIDTVERLQGGQRPTVIVSATASDVTAISANVEFLMNLNRANVAFSRAQERLIVVCSRSLLEHIPAEVEHYESAMLWKALREVCTETLAEEVVQGHRVEIKMCPPVVARGL